jgi:anti-sigma factor RsiW
MTCGDVTQLLEAFVDGELPGAMLLEVARHAASCPPCDAAVRSLEAVRGAVERTVREAADRLDLGPVWPAVAAATAREDTRRAWRRRLRALPAWGAAAAMAASAVLWFRAPATVPGPATARPARPNQAVIERLDTAGGRFEIRRERKNGTTLIMVSNAEMSLP